MNPPIASALSTPTQSLVDKQSLIRRWVLSETTPSEELLAVCPSPLVAQILANRGINTPEEARFYLELSGEHSPSESDPYAIPQMDLAVTRVERAIQKNERIFIYGDYDVDGTTSTALLYDALQKLGADVHYYIPHRLTEGYGLNSNAVVRLRSTEKAKLLITCDCGITNYAEVKLAQSLGLDVIVTDHHSLPEELPPAVAVLNPKLLAAHHPLHWLPGVGVAYKLAYALLSRADRQEAIRPLLDLVALGIVADLAPLRAENRLLAKEGMQVLNQTQRPGLKALLIECGQWSNEEGIGFALAPRINAAGRLSDANLAVKLFLSADPLESKQIAQELSEQNRLRQALCEETFQQAIERVEAEQPDPEHLSLIALADERWHHGVVGIVASRLVEKYHVPVFLAVIDQDKVKGSARSIPGIDLVGEITKFADLLDRFGGHQAAAGYSLAIGRWDEFREGLQRELRAALTSELRKPTLSIDAELSEEQLKLEEFEEIWSLAPFGIGFPKPVFTLKKPADLLDVKPLGTEGNHSKLYLRADHTSFEALHWRAEPQLYLEARQQGALRLAFTPNKNIFRNKPNLQLEVRDWKLAKLKPLPVSRTIETISKDFDLIDLRDRSDFDKESLKAETDCLIWDYLIDRKTDQKNFRHLVLWSIPLEGDLGLSQILNNNPINKITLIGANLSLDPPDLKNFLRRVRDFCAVGKCFTLEEGGLKLETTSDALSEALQILRESGAIRFNQKGSQIEIIHSGAPTNTSLKTQNLRTQLNVQAERQKALKYMTPSELITYFKKQK
ncbi:MAG: single-stranded-DNA-specific exonuclease RecJ [Candidatus Caenarcaniphilales bacterium]|nr:single-stranded-DNA-specific exonuclease RecJ [Candidatus Caenarcaniphilales bacterium]